MSNHKANTGFAFVRKNVQGACLGLRREDKAELGGPGLCVGAPSYLAHPHGRGPPPDARHLTAQRVLSPVDHKQRLPGRREQVLAEEAAVPHDPAGPSPRPGRARGRLLQVLQHARLARGQLQGEQARAAGRGGERAVLAALGERGLEGHVGHAPARGQAVERADLPPQRDLLHVQPGAVGRGADHEAPVGGHVWGAAHVPVGAKHRVRDAVEQQLGGGGRGAVLSALDEEVAAQVGVGHGLGHAAVAPQADGLERHQRFQIDLVHGGVRLVEEEAEPAEEELRSEVGRGAVVRLKDGVFSLPPIVILRGSNSFVIRRTILQGTAPSVVHLRRQTQGSGVTNAPGFALSSQALLSRHGKGGA